LFDHDVESLASGGKGKEKKIGEDPDEKEKAILGEEARRRKQVNI